jgi:predicted O-methyltransferase YrrM
MRLVAASLIIIFVLLAAPHAGLCCFSVPAAAAGEGGRPALARQPGSALSRGGGETTASVRSDIVELLQQIKAADREQLAVSEEDGRFLRMMVAATGATRALEIGAASGYSAIWIGLGLRQTGGTLTAIEYDPARAKAAAQNVRRAGLSDVVTIVSGDAFKELPKLPGTFDFVFLDAWKRDYKRFFDMVFPRLRPGGLFLGHNVVNKKEEMGDFLETIHNNPAVMTTIVSPSGEGMSVSFKVR